MGAAALKTKPTAVKQKQFCNFEVGIEVLYFLNINVLSARNFHTFSFFLQANGTKKVPNQEDSEPQVQISFFSFFLFLIFFILQNYRS